MFHCELFLRLPEIKVMMKRSLCLFLYHTILVSNVIQLLYEKIYTYVQSKSKKKEGIK